MNVPKLALTAENLYDKDAHDQHVNLSLPSTPSSFGSYRAPSMTPPTSVSAGSPNQETWEARPGWIPSDLEEPARPRTKLSSKAEAFTPQGYVLMPCFMMSESLPTDLSPPPDFSPPTALSKGSEKHGSGECKPCAFFWKPIGCQQGKGCIFCHACPPGEKNARKKAKAWSLKAGQEPKA
mmetsp:Transcript_28195/g.50897  ORF Transcript_28195/g.50897 Transcript_28195/m.50897 type:complete len:180 (+) Transcript_28195:64-603(+)